MLHFNVPLVLASRSPRRRFLLERLGLTPEVWPSEAEEIIYPGVAPAQQVERLALDKAVDVATFFPEGLVLGADTVVVVDGNILGKPESENQAQAMLRALSGRTHTVYTGIALAHRPSSRIRTAHAATAVTFGDLSEMEIARYVAGGSPMDKAGAYGIQDDAGALFVERIDGDYYNVVGLPLRTLYLMLVAEFSDLVVT